MFRAHVLIIRRSKLYYTASGIITPEIKIWLRQFTITLSDVTDTIFFGVLLKDDSDD